jgi:dTDP-4-amino-4,6-dideoxygalactose transaminase
MASVDTTTFQKREEKLPFAQPSIGDEEVEEVVDSLESGWLTSGPKVRRFEEEVADYLGAEETVAVNSCTGALFLTLKALGIGEGDEVLVPSFTFCSTVNVIVHTGAQPVFVDIGEDYLMDMKKAEDAISSSTEVIIPVHYGGQPCDLKSVYELAQKHDLAVLEDAAHAIGSSYRGDKIGSSSHLDRYSGSGNVRSAAAYSFYAIKNMTTGEGGMLATCDEDLADKVRLLRLHGMSRDAWKRYSEKGSWYYEVVEAGYKYNLTDMQAALGLHQLEKLDSFIDKRQKYASIYDEAFSEVEGLGVPISHEDRMHPYHLYELKVESNVLNIGRDKFISELDNRNVGTSVHWIPNHMQPYYKDEADVDKTNLSKTEEMYKKSLSLPIYPKMERGDIDYVISAVYDILDSF